MYFVQQRNFFLHFESGLIHIGNKWCEITRWEREEENTYNHEYHANQSFNLVSSTDVSIAHSCNSRYSKVKSRCIQIPIWIVFEWVRFYPVCFFWIFLMNVSSLSFIISLFNRHVCSKNPNTWHEMAKH